MAILEKIEFFALPAARVIGREAGLSLSMGMENPVPALWGGIYGDGTMDVLKKLPLVIPDCAIGWIGDAAGENYRYIAGVMTAPQTPVPAGLQYRDIAACDLAKGFMRGGLHDGDVYSSAYELTVKGIAAHRLSPDESFGWSAEVYPGELLLAEAEGTLCYFVPYKR